MERCIFMKKQINSKTEIQVRQKVNWPFGTDSEGVETHKKSSRCRKIISFDLGWLRSLRSRFAIWGFRNSVPKILTAVFGCSSSRWYGLVSFRTSNSPYRAPDHCFCFVGSKMHFGLCKLHFDNQNETFGMICLSEKQKKQKNVL